MAPVVKKVNEIVQNTPGMPVIVVDMPHNQSIMQDVAVRS